MRYVRIYADENGDSHLEDVDVAGVTIPRAASGRSVTQTRPVATTEISFLEIAVGADSVGQLAADPHVAPRRQWVIILAGRGVVTTTDGNERELDPGDVVFAEDTAGRGHWTTPLTSNLSLAMIPTGG